ncbi:lysostaphin resistance A-like protein [Nonomuraea sp. NPDC050556]|uniref:lysostaphin resistance A-like protein n=1 Tax=Nonomuraea sp. NPDC050556 TaxID=3364369 RepID=UPI0037A0F57B
MIALWGVLTYALTIAGILWLRATGQGPQDLSPAVVLIAISPSVAAVIVTAATGQLRSLASRRAALGWYALVLVVPVGLALTFCVVSGQGVQAIELAMLGPLLTGALGEELGWRGFGQPRLQSRYGPLYAALVVGALWTVWHLWPTLSGMEAFSAADVASSAVRLMAASVVYAWLYNRAGLLVVIAAHVGHNLAVDLVPPQPALGTVLALLYLAAAVAVVPSLTRQRALSAGPS